MNDLILAIYDDGRSLGAIALEAGISQPVLSRIVNGHTKPQPKTIYKLSKALGLNYTTPKKGGTSCVG